MLTIKWEVFLQNFYQIKAMNIELVTLMLDYTYSKLSFSVDEKSLWILPHVSGKSSGEPLHGVFMHPV